MQPPPVARVRRSQAVRHVILSIGLWATYLLYWRIVLSRGVESDAGIAFVLLGLFVVVQVAAIQAWVLHNRRIARTHAGRRRSRIPAPALAGSDFHGRRIRVLPEGSDLRRVPMIVVTVDPETGEKRFETGFGASAAMSERRAR